MCQNDFFLGNEVLGIGGVHLSPGTPRGDAASMDFASGVTLLPSCRQVTWLEVLL